MINSPPLFSLRLYFVVLSLFFIPDLFCCYLSLYISFMWPFPIHYIFITELPFEYQTNEYVTSSSFVIQIPIVCCNFYQRASVNQFSFSFSGLLHLSWARSSSQLHSGLPPDGLSFPRRAPEWSSARVNSVQPRGRHARFRRSQDHCWSSTGKEILYASMVIPVSLPVMIGGVPVSGTMPNWYML